MTYDKFNIINSSAVPLNIDNVDTDQIIPARYLKATERKGFGDNLFRDWRYDSNNKAIKDFPLNNKNYSEKSFYQIFCNNFKLITIHVLFFLMLHFQYLLLVFQNFQNLL